MRRELQLKIPKTEQLGNFNLEMKKMNRILIFALAALFLASCGGNKDNDNNTNNPDTNQVQNINIPQFNADSAYAYVAAQVDFGPRVPGSTAHENCAEYLISELERHGLEVTVQEATVRTYDGTIFNGKNIIGSFDPSNTKRVMLSSHWDSRPYADWDPDPANHRTPIPGANDGASGVGILLEIARLLVQSPPKIGIDIVFWDMEDYGEPHDGQNSGKEDTWGLGSQYWSKNMHKPGYNANYGILLDMVGAENAVFRMEGFSQQFAPSIVRKVWNHAKELGYGDRFIFEESNPIMDDHYYVNKYANIPTIDIIHQDNTSGTGFFTYWHTLEDNMDKIDKQTLKMVGEVVLKTIYSEK